MFLADRLDATDPTGDAAQQVALKRILPHLVEEREFVDRFIDEARLMIKLRHRNLLPVYELRRDRWGLYMVMEYLKGYDLRTLNRAMRSQDQEWPVSIAVWVIREICEGLSYAHQQRDERGSPLGLVHRDVSPSNILIGENGAVKLIDFGVARAQGGIHQSVSGALQGKLIYMSPEQAQGGEAGPQSDLFSLGLTLYEMLSGKRPREGTNDAETLRLAQSDQRLRLEEDWPEGDSELTEIVNQLIVYPIDQRIQSAQELSARLTAWLERDGAHPALSVLLSNHLDKLADTQTRADHNSSKPRLSALDINQALELQLITAQSEPTEPDHLFTPENFEDQDLRVTYPYEHGRAESTLSLTPDLTPDLTANVTASLAPSVTSNLTKSRAQIADPQPQTSHDHHSSEVDHRSTSLLASAYDQASSLSTSGVLISQDTEDFGALLHGLGALDFEQRDTAHPPSPNDQDSKLGAPGEGSKRRPKNRRRALGLVVGFSLCLLYLLFWVNSAPKMRIKFGLTRVIDGVETPLDLRLIDHITVDGQPWTPLSTWRGDLPLEVCITHPEWKQSCRWVTLNQLEDDRDARNAAHSSPDDSNTKLLTLSMHPRSPINTLFSRVLTAPKNDEGATEEEAHIRPSELSKTHESRIEAPNDSQKVPSQTRKERLAHALPSSKSLRRLKRPKSGQMSNSIKVLTHLKQLSLNCSDQALKSDSSKSQSYKLKPGVSLNLSHGMHCQAKAPHHAARTFVLPTQPNYQVILEPIGTLSVRVHPPASRIWIDEREVNNPSHRLTLTGRDHTLLIRYRDRYGKSVEERRELKLKAGDKHRIYLDMSREHNSQ